MLTSFYRTAVPASARGWIWEVRAEGVGATLREWVARRKVARGTPLVVAKLDGMRLAVDLRDRGAGRPLYVQRSFSDAERTVFRRLLAPGDVVVDAGANIGVLSCAAARLVGPGGLVVAIEPDPHNLGLLEQNIAANSPGLVEVVRAALGAEPGVARLFLSPENFGDHRIIYGAGREAIDVPVVTLDSVMDRIGRLANFIKIDVQGYEPHVLRGATRTLATPGLKALLTEFWPSGIRDAGGDPLDYFDTLEKAGLRPHILEADGSVTPCTYASALERIAAKARPEVPEGAFCNLLFLR